MKKTLLTLGIICLASTSALAQSMSIKEIGTSTDISGTTVQVSASSSASVVINFDVYNESSTTETFKILRRILSQPSDWENSICWGAAGAGTCFPSYSSILWTTPNAVSLNQGEYGSLTVDIHPSSNYNQSAHYRYYSGTVANPKMDSIDVVVNQSASIKDVKKDLSLSVAPNPAYDILSIKVSNFEKGNLRIIDVLGNVVKNDAFYGSKSIDVSEFRNGVYFIVISGEGVNTINRKLVVKH